MIQLDILFSPHEHLPFEKCKRYAWLKIIWSVNCFTLHIKQNWSTNEYNSSNQKTHIFQLVFTDFFFLMYIRHALSYTR